MGTFECQICRKPFNIFGLEESADARIREEAAEKAKHYHWCDVHRVCAKCGQHVKSDDLASAVNDGRIEIHGRYTDQYQKIERGDTRYLLIVHERCL